MYAANDSSEPMRQQYEPTRFFALTGAIHKRSTVLVAVMLPQIYEACVRLLLALLSLHVSAPALA